jgi:tubulin alpha
MVVPEGDIGSMERSCSMLSNSTAISEVFGRMNYKFDVLYSKRAFVHWYIQEGQEES